MCGTFGQIMEGW